MTRLLLGLTLMVGMGVTSLGALPEPAHGEVLASCEGTGGVTTVSQRGPYDIGQTRVVELESKVDGTTIQVGIVRVAAAGVGWRATRDSPRPATRLSPVAPGEPISMTLPIQPLDAVVHKGEQLMILLDQGHADHVGGAVLRGGPVRLGPRDA